MAEQEEPGDAPFKHGLSNAESNGFQFLVRCVGLCLVAEEREHNNRQGRLEAMVLSAMPDVCLTTVSTLRVALLPQNMLQRWLSRAEPDFPV